MTTAHPGEAHPTSVNAKLNTLRAGVLGANDGIVSTSALLLGVIASGAGSTAIFTAGMAAAVAGAVSMALGEYVSVSAQRDSEKSLIAKETGELTDMPAEETMYAPIEKDSSMLLGAPPPPLILAFESRPRAPGPPPAATAA